MDITLLKYKNNECDLLNVNIYLKVVRNVRVILLRA